MREISKQSWFFLPILYRDREIRSPDYTSMKTTPAMRKFFPPTVEKYPKFISWKM
jgi:hypothetical protein